MSNDTVMIRLQKDTYGTDFNLEIVPGKVIFILTFYYGIPQASFVNKIHIFQCMAEIFCVEFQMVPEILDKISWPCFERFEIYATLKFW